MSSSVFVLFVSRTLIFEEITPFTICISFVLFRSRPRASQIGAWTSQQSKFIEDRAALEKQELEIKTKFDGLETIPRPPHWGGYRLIPSRIEFWKGRESRLHDRIVFLKEEGSQVWTRQRLQP